MKFVFPSILIVCDIGAAVAWHGWVLMNAFLAGIDWARKTDVAHGEEAEKKNG
jgi:hypothetical protein